MKKSKRNTAKSTTIPAPKCSAVPLTCSQTALFRFNRIEGLITPDECETAQEAHLLAVHSLAFRINDENGDEVFILPPADSVEAFYLRQLLENVTPDSVLLPKQIAFNLAIQGWLEQNQSFTNEHSFCVLELDAICAAFPAFLARYNDSGAMDTNLLHCNEMAVIRDWFVAVLLYQASIHSRTGAAEKRG